MNAEEYEHIWFWEKPKLFCKQVEEAFIKAMKEAEKKTFDESEDIDLFKNLDDDYGFSKN